MEQENELALLRLKVKYLEQHIAALNALIEQWMQRVIDQDRIIAAYEKLHEERKAQA